MSERDHDLPPPAGLSVRRFTAKGVHLALVSFALPPNGELKSESDRAAAELTSTEVELLRELLRGSSNADIARVRGTSIKTVSNQVSALLAKFGAKSRTDLATRWLELLTPPS
ncbi:MAG: LuxR C-terminal-related transcriptional regulator [Polyangiaceae bacterium]